MSVCSSWSLWTRRRITTSVILSNGTSQECFSSIHFEWFNQPGAFASLMNDDYEPSDWVYDIEPIAHLNAHHRNQIISL